MPLRVKEKDVLNDHCRVRNVVLTCTRRLHTASAHLNEPRGKPYRRRQRDIS